jgi:hypothetical protein
MLEITKKSLFIFASFLLITIGILTFYNNSTYINDCINDVSENSKCKDELKDDSCHIKNETHNRGTITGHCDFDSCDIIKFNSSP